MHTAGSIGPVVVLEEDPLVRRALTGLLQGSGVGTVVPVESTREAIGVLRAQPVRVVLSDFTLADTSYEAFAAAARDIRPLLALVVLAGDTDPALATAAAATPGVVAVLSKYGEPELLGPRIALAVHGGMLLDETTRRLLEQSREEVHWRRWTALSAREREVLRHVNDGLSMALIARRMGLAESTAKHHAAKAAVRLGVTSSREAARQAQRLGLLDEPADTGSEGKVIDLRGERRNEVG
jgi:DNA-binding NarL/FixJ family response regulator